MVRENLFIYMTSVVVKLEKILVKIRYLLENKIPNHLNFFLCFKLNFSFVCAKTFQLVLKCLFLSFKSLIYYKSIVFSHYLMLSYEYLCHVTYKRST